MYKLLLCNFRFNKLVVFQCKLLFILMRESLIVIEIHKRSCKN